MPRAVTVTFTCDAYRCAERNGTGKPTVETLEVEFSPEGLLRNDIPDGWSMAKGRAFYSLDLMEMKCPKCRDVLGT